MQTANNTNNYTVEGLVAKYRNFVAENTPKVREFDGVEFFEAPASTVDSNPDQQLIVTLYKFVAGKKADKKVLETLSEYEQHFYKDALDSNEFTFLCENFSDVIAYEFSHRHEWGGEHDSMRFMFSNNYKKIKELIHERIHVEKGMTIYIPSSGYCDIASLFSGCIVKGYSTQFYDPNSERDEFWEKKSNKVWALGQIRLYAAAIKSEIIPWYDFEQIESLKNSVDLILCDSSHFVHWDCNELYPLLKDGGKMFIFAKREDLVDYSKHKAYQFTFNKKNKQHNSFDSKKEIKRKAFFKMIIGDKTIKSISAYQDDIITLGWSEDCVLIVIEKNEHSTVTVESINQGTIADVNIAELDADMLWPGYYLTKRPQNGKPLSSLVNVFNTNAENVKQYWDRKAKKVTLSGDIKVLIPREASANFAGACLSNQDFRSVSDSMFDGWESKFICPNQPGVCLYGSSEGMVLWYIDEDPTDKYVCVDIIPYLVPKKGVDHRYIAALLLTPEVKQQIESICDGTITTYTMSLILDKIIVPNHTPKERLQFLANASFDAMRSSQEKLKKKHDDYKKAVRMRKHALTQSLSSIEDMFDVLNYYREQQNGKLSNEELISIDPDIRVKEAFDFLSSNIKELMPAMEHVADVDYTFSSIEWIDPNDFIEEYIEKNKCGWINFKPIITWERGYNKHTVDTIDPITGEIAAKKGDSIHCLSFPKDALELVFNNILSNVKAHAFTNESRNDYKLQFSWHTDGLALIIEIANNGTPIPNDLDVSSLLEYGVSSKLHQDGHNGIGCNEIDDIMRRYNGKVEIASTPDKEFTVKYVLTFKSNNYKKEDER